MNSTEAREVRQKEQAAREENRRVWEELDKRVREGVKEGIAEWKQAAAVDGARDGTLNVRRPNLGPAEHPITNRAIASTPDAPGRVLDGKFPSFGHFARAVTPQHIQRHGLPDALRNISNDLSSIEPSAGGFLLPEEFRAEMLSVGLERSLVRPRAFVIPMSTASVLLPGFDVTSNASSVFGGVTFGWTEEGAAITESQPVFDRIRLSANKLAGYSELPNELIADSPISVDAFLGTAFAQGIAFEEDDAFLNGNGVGQPLGVLNSGALVSVAKVGGQTADTIVWENILKMFARVLPAAQRAGVWVAHPSTFPELGTMALSVGTGGSAIWLNEGAGSQPPTILGRPLLFSEKVPPLGDEGDIGFYDFGFYLLGDRQQMSLQSSVHLKFQNDMTVYRVIERVDGRPSLLSAITPRSGTDTLSPFVTLAERA